MDNPSEITYIGKTDFRNAMTKFGIKAKDRTKHAYVIGKTGTGKSTFLENMILQDIHNGNGVAFIDPHGGSAEKLLDYIPEERINDVIYLNPSDVDFPVAFNPLEDSDPERRALVADGLMTVFEKIWPEAFSGRMTYILNNTMLALLEYPNPTLLSINRFLTDKDFRKRVVANVQDPTVKNAWDELGRWDDKRWSEATGALINKIGQFTTNPLIRNIVGQPQSTFDFRTAMDERKIVIINLSKGKIGEQNQPLFGAMLITKIYLAAMSRADLPATVLEKVPPFYFYVDEFQNFANDSFANILSEARKYKLCLTVANQYVNQMAETIRDAVFGNMGTIVSFRVGALDSALLEKVFTPTFTANDLENLQFGQYYITLQIDGMGSRPFSAQNIWPLPVEPSDCRDKVIETSRTLYARPRSAVEGEIIEWFGYNKKPEEKTKPEAEYKKPADKKPEPKSEQPMKKSFDKKPQPPQKKTEPDVSSTMMDLLDKLESGEITQVTESKKSTPEPVVTKNLDKKEKDRAAKPETKNALFEALQKAQQLQQQEKKSVPPPQPVTVSPDALQQTIKQALHQEPEPQEQPPANKSKSATVREVPEEILKKLLE